MAANADVKTFLRFAIAHLAAESYLEDLPTDPDLRTEEIIRRFKFGFNDPLHSYTQTFSEREVGGQDADTPTLPGNNRMVELQASEVLRDFEIVNHRPNDQTGFSGTLMRNRVTNEYVLAFRSTEFRPWDQAGDRQRDVTGANLEIANYGFAFGQLVAMEHYYAYLKETGLLPERANLTVTGYSLSGHLSTLFTLIHESEVAATYIYNGAGHGELENRPTDAQNIAALIASFGEALLRPSLSKLNPDNLSIPGEGIDGQIHEQLRSTWEAAKAAALTNPDWDPFAENATENGRLSAYDDARYQFALQVLPYVEGGFHSLINVAILSNGSTPLSGPGYNKITQIYGLATHDDAALVANSQIHSANRVRVFIEDQPDVFGVPFLKKDSINNDFGTTHSLILTIDALALVDLVQGMNSTLSLDEAQGILAAASNMRAQGGLGREGRSEGDSLERILDAIRGLIAKPAEPASLASTPFDDVNDGFGNFTNRTKFYSNLDEVQQKLASGTLGAVSLVSLVGAVPTEGFGRDSAQFSIPAPKGTVEIMDLSETDLGYRVALNEMNPFALIGNALYSEYRDGGAKAGELEIYDPSRGQNHGSLSRRWLADRAEFVRRKLVLNLNNLNNDLTKPANNSPQADPMQADSTASFRSENVVYADLASEYRIDFGVIGAYQRITFGGRGTDLLQGGKLDDRLYGEAGTDVLIGGQANDYLEGGAGLDVYQYSAASVVNDGVDEILDTDGNGVLRYTFNASGSSSTSLLGGIAIKSGDNEWTSPDGRFTYTRLLSGLLAAMNGNAGASVRILDFDYERARSDGYLGIRLIQPRTAPQFAAPTSSVLGDENSNNLPGTAAGDEIFGFGGNDTINAGGGDDLVWAGADADAVDGGADQDQIYGDGGNDRIGGGFGNDELYGGADQDFVSDSGGNNLIEGGPESDVLYAYGAGNDEIYGNATVTIASALLAGEGVGTGAKGDWIMAGPGSDLVISGADNDALLGGGGGDIVVGGAGDDDIAGDLGWVTNTLDWTVTRVSDAQGAHLNFGPSAVLDSSAGDGDAIYAGAGEDWIVAGEGDDFVDTGLGDDIATGGAGSDILIGAAGSDVLVGDESDAPAAGDAADYLDGGAGVDYLYGNGGDDIVVGGAGDDYLAGGNGKDIYIYAKGDGIDTLKDMPPNADNPEASIIVTFGIARRDVKFRVGSLMVDFGGGDAIHFENFDQANPGNTPLIGELRFDDGQAMTYADILAQGFDIDGTSAADLITGTGVVDRIRGLEGNDVLAALDGDDFLYGGSGSDTLQGGEDSDYLEGGDGFDILQGGAGDDTYVYDTFDVIVDTDGVNRIAFGSGIEPENLVITSFVVGGQPRLLIANPGESGPGLEIRGATLTTPNFIYAFADGHTLSQADFVQRSYYVAQNLYGGSTDDTLIGFAGNDSLFGGDGNDRLLGNGGNDALTGSDSDDVLYGGAGQDNLYGGAGTDSLHGGPGKDYLSGGLGADTYLFGYGDGLDTVADQGTDSAVDSVRLADGISAAEVSIRHEANGDLAVTLNGTPDELVVQGWYTSANSRVERIVFGDGAALEEAALAQIPVLPISGTSGNDQLNGTAYADTLVGLQGDDTLDGGLGDDVLDGGEGADSYVLGWGTGIDTVMEQASETSNIVLAPSMTLDDVLGVRSGDDLFLHTRRTEHGLLLKDYYTQEHDWQIETYGGAPQPLVDFLAQPVPTTGNEVFDLWQATLTEYKAEFYSWGGSWQVLPDGRIYKRDLDISTSFSRYYYNGDVLGSGSSGSPPYIGTWEEYRALGPVVSVSSDAPSQFWPGAGETYEQSSMPATYTVNWDPAQTSTTTYYMGTYVGADSMIRPLYWTQFQGDARGDIEGIDLGSSAGASSEEVLLAALGRRPLPNVVNGEQIVYTQTLLFDEVHAGPSSNVIEFDGNGFLNGGAGNDLLDASMAGSGSGSGTPIRLLYGGAGSDRATGSGASDLLIGGDGSDLLTGRTGDDTYYFMAGDTGMDVVNEVTYQVWETVNATSGGVPRLSESDRDSTDTVEFGRGLALDGLSLSWGIIDSSYSRSFAAPYQTLDITWSPGNGVRVLLPDLNSAWVLQDMITYPGQSWGVEYFKFADGALLTMDEMANRVPVTVLNGTSDDDYLQGTWGRDVLGGGAGSDYVEGAAGNDTYRFNVGDGEDWIDDVRGNDTVVFGPGITPDMITLGLGSLRLQIGSTGDVLHMERFDPEDALGSGAIETYQFDSGVSLTHAQLLERGFDLIGTVNGETLSGTSVGDRIVGHGGDDTLIGGAGDDSLEGGAGNDLLSGGEGDDVYAFATGSGQDAVDETDAQADDVDALALGPGITPQSLVFSRFAQDLVLHVDGTSDSLTLRRWYDGASHQIEEIRFDGGPTWSAETIARSLPPPEPPVPVNPIADQTASEDAQFLFAFPADTFVDPDAGNLTYAVSRPDGTALPVWLSFDASTRSFSGRPAQADVGGLDVRVVTTDPDGLSAEDVFRLNVLNTNDAPVLANLIPDQVTAEATLFTFTVAGNTFLDEDLGDVLTLRAERYVGTSSGGLLPPPPLGGGLPPPPPPGGGSLLPSWLHFDAATETFSGTPASADTGTVQIKVTATDRAGASVSDVFGINVNANHAPVLQSLIADQAATEDEPFFFTVPSNAITDPDAGDMLTWSAAASGGEALPGWLAFDAINRVFTGSPTNDDVGYFSVRLTGTDQWNASASAIFRITVANTDDGPMLSQPIADQAATEDQPFEFIVPSAMFVDVDAGDSLTLSSIMDDGSSLPAWLQFDAATRTFSGTPANDDVGVLSVRITATDTSGAAASDSFAIAVANTNDAPALARPIADRSAIEDEAFEFFVRAGTFKDVDVGDTLTLSASLDDGSPLPAWLAFNGSMLSGTPLNEDVGAYGIKLTATDAAGASATDLFNLEVANVNDAPVVAHPLADQSVEAGGSFAFAVPADTFLDVDAGDTLAMSAAATEGDLPAWLRFDPATATFSGSPRESDMSVSGIVVTAIDGSGASASSDFALVVTAAAGATVRGGSGDDILFGSTGNEILAAGQGDDALFGGAGDDVLSGGGGSDVLQGGDGDDVLRAGPGKSLLDGGAGDDLIFDSSGNSFIAGGTGNDTVRLSTGADVLSFNAGDGWDTVYGGGDGGNTLSLGGGIRYSDLRFSKSGSDLVLHAGEDNAIVLKDWYGGTHSILNLQIIQEASEEFDASASDSLRSRRVQTFNFLGLVESFDQARAASPGLTSWDITNALLQWHLWGADDSALGGDLAYWYGKNRTLAGMSLAAAQQVIGAAGFGSDAQSLRPFSGLQEGFAKLG